MKRLSIALVSALAVAMLVVSLLSAQSTSPIYDTFDTTVSGWAPVLHLYQDGTYHTYATASWEAITTLTDTRWWRNTQTQGTGVLKVAVADQQFVPDVQKSVYLQPGAYRIKMRVGSYSEASLGVDIMGGTVAEPGGYLRNYSVGIGPAFEEKTTDVFAVTAPGRITIILSANSDFVIDWIELENYGGTPPTQVATLAYTAVPTEMQATPMPAATQYCQPAPAATGPAEFGATPTPDTSGDWQFTDAFSEESLGSAWEISNAGATVNTNVTGPDNAAGVLEMRFASPGSVPQLVYQHAITPTVYVDGWAMADALPIGETAEVHVMLWDTPTYGWVEAGSQEFGPGQWYPFHIVVTDPGLHTTPSTAIALYVSGPAGGIAYLDNVTIYNTTRLAPVCGFSPYVGGPANEMYVTYPYGKPCPTAADGFGNVPNNFWGPLFYWMSVQFLNITAPFPMHVFQGYALAIQQFGDAPFWRYVSVVTMMFDLRPVVAMAIVLIALEGVRLLYSAWRLLLKIIPMMG